LARLRRCHAEAATASFAAPPLPSPGTPMTSTHPHKKRDKSFLSRIRERLSKTRRNIVDKLVEVVTGRTTVDEDLIEEIEMILIQADVGVQTTRRIVDELKKRAGDRRLKDSSDILRLLRRCVLEIIEPDEYELAWDDEVKPFVVLVIGVNGTGKTTTIGKLAKEYREQGASVLMVAADTFRAAAADQLEIWARDTGCDIVRQKEGADPAAVVYDGLDRAIREEYDVVLIDTAGRLHTKKNLMEEMKKILRVIRRHLPEAPHESVLVLDATTGQNAISQAKTFHEALELSAIVMTKLDGTAKGGILIAIRDLFKIPIVKVGVGEGVDDLKDFVPADFVLALFGGEMEELADMLVEDDEEDELSDDDPDDGAEAESENGEEEDDD
jgi:fused signal recognition particle receptor